MGVVRCQLEHIPPNAEQAVQAVTFDRLSNPPFRPSVVRRSQSPTFPTFPSQTNENHASFLPSFRHYEKHRVAGLEGFVHMLPISLVTFELNVKLLKHNSY